jgi:hypothetical protein
MDEPEFLLFGIICAAVAAWLLSENSQTDATLVTDSTPRGIRNNNPLNLKYIAGDPYEGQTGQDANGFGIYSSWQLGVRAAGQQLTKNFASGATTIFSLVDSWSTTDQTTYQNYVAAQLGVGVATPLVWPDDELRYVMAAISFENGENPYSSMDVQAALNMS